MSKFNSDTILKGLNIIDALAALAPLVPATIHAVQAAIPDVPGETKLATAKDWIGHAADQMGVATTTFSGVWPVVEKTIANLVAFYKSAGTGAFAPAAAPAAPAAPANK